MLWHYFLIYFSLTASLILLFTIFYLVTISRLLFLSFCKALLWSQRSGSFVTHVASTSSAALTPCWLLQVAPPLYFLWEHLNHSPPCLELWVYLKLGHWRFLHCSSLTASPNQKVMVSAYVSGLKDIGIDRPWQQNIVWRVLSCHLRFHV